MELTLTEIEKFEFVPMMNPRISERLMSARDTQRTDGKSKRPSLSYLKDHSEAIRITKDLQGIKCTQPGTGFQSTIADLIITDKTTNLACENLKFNKKLETEKAKAALLPEYRREAKSLKVQVLELKAQMSKMVKIEYLTTLQGQLRAKEDELFALKKEFESHKKEISL